MCCKSAIRCWLFFILIFWLLLTCARQVFDLIGKLWLPVSFNLLQILSCISGLFAAGQQRVSLLITLAVTSSLSVAYNVLIMLWYANMIGDRNKPLLSFGLPYSHSFFLRYTPFCKSEFNLTTSKWIQEKSCMVPFYNIEGIQAMIHVLVGLLTAALALMLICERRNKNGKQKLEDGYSSSRSSKSGKTMPNLAAAIYGDAEKRSNNKSIPDPPDSINDVSSGYMNSSYEAVGQVETKKDENNYKKSKKKSGILNKKNVRPKSALTMEMCSQHEEYSSVTTKSLTNSSVESRPVKPRPKQPFLSSKQSPKKKMVNRSVSPIRRNSDEGFSEEEDISRQYSKMRQKTARPAGKTQSLAEQRLSQAALEQLRKESFRNQKNTAVGSSIRMKQKIVNIVESEGKHYREDSGEYLEYIKADRKGSTGNLTSLISFDPKSDTLIRVTEHISHDDDDRTCRSDTNAYREVIDPGVKLRTRRTTSQESVPSIQAPVYSGSTSNLDSGHPSSTTNSVSPDWSQAGIAHVIQRPVMSPPLPPPPKEALQFKKPEILGYDPSVSDNSSTSAFQILQNPQPPPQQPQLLKCQRSTSFSSQANYVSMSTAIPLVDSLPDQSCHSSTRFLSSTQPEQSRIPPDYAIPPSASNYYFSPGDYGLKLMPADNSPTLPYKQSKSLDSTQFTSKPAPNAPIILNNTGLLV